MDETNKHFTDYAKERLEQLRAGGFEFWVYRHDSIGCEDQHEDLDGLALPPDHRFWTSLYPPITATCGCYVVGASSARAAQRLGGDPEKPIPQWCEIPT